MADENMEVKDVDRVEVTPTQDDENVGDEEAETSADSSQPEDTEDGADSEEEEEPEKIESPASQLDADDLKEVPGETPRERALRLEVTRLKRLNQGERSKELFDTKGQDSRNHRELPADKAKVLEKYNQEELANLREVIDVMAEDMGFVRKDELNVSTFMKEADGQFDKFIEKHPEYLPENDKDNVLWGRLKEEFSLYKSPDDPKTIGKILEKCHREVFGIQDAGALKNNNAGKEKIKVASHANSSAHREEQMVTKREKASGLRLDMLKGFSEDEINELDG